MRFCDPPDLALAHAPPAAFLAPSRTAELQHTRTHTHTTHTHTNTHTHTHIHRNFSALLYLLYNFRVIYSLYAVTINGAFQNLSLGRDNAGFG